MSSHEPQHAYLTLPPEYQLHRACRLGHVNEVRCLLQHGAPPNFTVGNKSCLLVALENSQPDVAFELLRRGADANETIGHQRNSLLHMAVRRGDHGIARLLLEHNADPNKLNAAGQTALHLACRNGLAYLVDDLLNHGASVNLPDRSGNSPLIIAAKAGQTEVCKTLLFRGANVNHKNQKGETPFHCAYKANHQATADLLLAHGAEASKPVSRRRKSHFRSQQERCMVADNPPAQSR